VRLALRAVHQEAKQVARGLDLRELLFLDADAERLLDPQPQLEPAQAVETEVALEEAVEAGRDHRRARPARLDEERVQDVDQGARHLVRRQRRGRVGGNGHARGEFDATAIVIRPDSPRVLSFPAADKERDTHGGLRREGWPGHHRDHGAAGCAQCG
jgi:hypothetical protein